MSNISSSQYKQLKDLTKKFVDLADDMKQKGVISEEQYKEMTDNKFKFLNANQL